MASADIYIFSSSPAAPLQLCANMSSSPEFPSPSQLLRKRPQALRAGSKAISIPTNDAGFTTAASLLANGTSDAKRLEGLDAFPSFQADNSEGDIFYNKTKAENARRPSAKKGSLELGGKSAENTGVATESTKPKTVRKPRAKKADAKEDKGAQKEKAPRKARAKKNDVMVDENGEVVVKEKVGRKAKGKKKDTETQPKLAAGRVTKNTGPKVAKPTKAQALLSEAVSKHFSSKVEAMAEGEGLMLEKAVKRRNSWTPPAPTTNVISLTTPLPLNLLDAKLTSGGSILSDEKCQNFSELIGNYGFTKTKDSTPKKVSDGCATRKRKLIELVSAQPSIPCETPVEKPKAIRKKPRTITEQATAAYVENEEGSVTRTAPLLQYFSFSGEDGGPDKDGFKLPKKSRSRSPAKGAPKTLKSKNSAQEPILLSPESALKQVDTQDFVFGTSSQLAREESPTFLRDLHQALQASNEVGDDPFTDDPFEDVLRDSIFSAEKSRRGIGRKAMKSNLWSAASRGEDGELLEVEMIDLVDSPAATKLQAKLGEQNSSLKQADISDLPASGQPNLDRSSGSNVPEHVPPPMDDDESWHDLTQAAPPPSQQLQIEKRKVGPIEAAIQLELSSPSVRKSPARPKAQKPTSPKKAPAKRSRKSQAKPQEKPDFTLLTDAQLSKEIASYHFKPIKKREAMIDLLEKCWESKQRMALGTLSTNKSICTSPTKLAAAKTATVSDLSPKRPRGRPRKDSLSVVASPLAKPRGRPRASQVMKDIDLDSDTPLSKLLVPKNSEADPEARSKSPQRRRTSRARTPPLSLSAPIDIDDEASPVLSPNATRARLFTHISHAVKEAPQSADSVNPGWYEKILLYDPIILEDLTIWLNTGALEKVGWDGEVAPWEVKKWCESKSICCLWKANLRGGTRSRY